MNDLESIILSLFDDGYTKSEIASLLDENLAKASSETEKAKHDALITEDAAKIYEDIVKYYSDKYNDPTFMDDQCPPNRLKQYLDTTYAICKRNEFSPVDATLERIQCEFYDYWYYTHDNTEIEITPEEITYILESYYDRDHVETTPELLRNIVELLNTYFMRTRKGYHGKEIYEWFPTPNDFAIYLDTIKFPSNNPFDDVKNNDIYESWDNYLAETQPNYTKGDIYRKFPNEEDFAKFISNIYRRYFESGADDIYNLLAQTIDTFLAKTVEDYEPGALTEMFPEPKNIGDYVITLYKTYKYFKTLGLNDKNDFGDILNLLFK